MKRVKKIIGYILDDLFVFSPFIFGFYLSVMAYFLINEIKFSLRIFFGSFLFLFLLILLSDKAKFHYLKIKKHKIKYVSDLLGVVVFKIKSVKKVNILKVLSVCLVSGCAFIKGINLLEILILIYGSIAVLFGCYKKYSLIFCIIILVFIPFFILLDLNIIAENAAIYAFYFLLIFFAPEILATANKGVDK